MTSRNNQPRTRSDTLRNIENDIDSGDAANASSVADGPNGSTYLLTSRQMMAAERAAMRRGLSGWRMMHRAGCAAAKCVVANFERFRKHSQNRDRAPTALVVCGGGNNGGDGYVIATRLQRVGWSVTVLSVAQNAEAVSDAPDAQCSTGGKSDASIARQQWLAESGKTLEFAGLTPENLGAESGAAHAELDGLLGGADVVIDAIFGTGLNRDLSAPLQSLIYAINATRTGRCLTVAVDMPSGADADTGISLPICVQADHTITFGWKKIAHAFMPSAAACGRVECVDIGLSLDDLAAASDIAVAKEGAAGDSARAQALALAGMPTVMENTPALWRDDRPQRRVTDHKYHHGYALITSGGVAPSLGAVRLASAAALRAGCGLVAIGADRQVAGFFAGAVGEELLRVYSDNDDASCAYYADGVAAAKVTNDTSEGNTSQRLVAEKWQDLLADRRIDAILIGPGGGNTELLRQRCEVALSVTKDASSGVVPGLVLDADALSCWQNRADDLHRMLRARASTGGGGAGCEVILTPHAGEFGRIFPDIAPQTAHMSKIDMAKAAAERSHAVVVFKGADTVIAAPDGRVAIQCDAPSGLAVAGSGDVLAGLIVALREMGMPAFSAACAGVWFHTEAARRLPRRFAVSDLIHSLRCDAL